jgi:RNA polymerase sigma factor (TIGR02999 family)
LFYLGLRAIVSDQQWGTSQVGGAVPRSSTKQSVSALLAKWHAGDAEALEAVVPLVYNELRRLAHRYLQKERPDHILQSTALVHEAYLRLMKQSGKKFENRAHFFAICAQLMRQILVEYARNRRAAKRDGGQTLTLNDTIALVKAKSVDLIALDDALETLAKLDLQQSRIVELRFFGGLSIEETSRVLDISEATVKRDWTTAKVWLHHEMSRTASHDA